VASAELGAEGKVSATSTQRIKLSLQPTLVVPGDEPARPAHGASPVSVYVHGDAVADQR